MSGLRPNWLKMQRLLHARYEAVCGLPDASHLAVLRGPKTRMSEAEWAELWKTAPTEGMNHLYLHVPFCKSICTFCNYTRLRPSSPDQLAEWLQRVLRSIDTIGPATSELEFHSLYLGGGTPSVLPAPMLDTVLTALRNGFQWHSSAGRHMELDPQVISTGRIEVLAKHGFNHYSFGVQTLDVDVNLAHNRGSQDREAVRRCFSMLRGAGSIHCDFLLGLDGTDPSGILTEIETVLQEEDPDTVDLFEIIPTEAYMQGHFGGDRDRFEAYLEPFRREIGPALKEIAARNARRVQGLGRHSYKLVRHPPKTTGFGRYGYTQLAHIEGQAVNLLGIGPSARSRIFGVAAMEAVAPEDREAPHFYEGDRGGREGELQVYLAHVLRDHDEVSFSALEALFGGNVREKLALPLASWEAEGLATVGADQISMPAMDGPARVRALLWLLRTEHLEHEIARTLGLPLAHWVANARVPIGDWKISGSEGTRLHLARGDDRVVLRLAPSLTDNGARWVVETGGEHARDQGLRRAVTGLRRELPRK